MGIQDSEYKAARNIYYSAIRKAKRKYWEEFLVGPQNEETDPRESERCWQALRYTNTSGASITPALKGPEGRAAVTIDEKEALVRETAFPPAPEGEDPERLPPWTWHTQIDEAKIKHALFY
ncbi:reverse transcriptase [Aspergillus affinis]|uniref:reverse transcriptase n=1 Tax=Aspergillus affinis TaxID=1070780 RepID=UPI0022FDEAB0|nr:reverse transcriptase [Aspergillus affinis]KAI9041358.1 reverse transcriptase [Aspergillus affinis]